MGHQLIGNENGLYCSCTYLDRRALLPEEAFSSSELDWIWLDQSRGYPDWARRYFPLGRPAAKVDSKSTGLAAALAGMGVVEMPVLIAQVIPRLVRLPNLQARWDKNIWILCHRDFKRTARAS